MQLPWQPSQRKPDSGPSSAPPWPPSATFCLLAAQGAVCLAQISLRRLHANADPLLDAGALTADGLRAWHLWEPITALFLTGRHATAWLLPASGLVLGLAGRPLEAIIGRRHLFQLFLLAGIGGGLGQVGLDRFLEHDDALTGSAASAAAVLWALACIMPRVPLLPGGTALGRFKVMHAALAVGAAAMAGAGRPPGAGVLFGCLAGCLYMRGLGFGRRAERTHPPADALPEVALTPSARWSQTPVQSPATSRPVMTVSATTAADPVAATPHFSDRERRMSAREYVSEQIDPILDKIARHGVGSLTDEDRRVLAKGREKLAASQ